MKIEPVKKQPEIGKSYTISKSTLEQIVGKYDEEKKKYIKCWSVDDYRRVSPGERLVESFLEAAQPEEGDTVIDWGCGTGRAAKKLFEAGLDVTLVDFAYNCLDKEVQELIDNDETGRIRFIEHDITEPTEIKSSFGFCTDVLEHLPEDRVDAALDTILNSSENVFFQIATVKDHFGKHPDIRKSDEEPEHLHLTVWSYWKWAQKFLEKKTYIYRSNDLQGAVVFYVSGWGSLDITKLVGTVNVPDEQIIANMEANAKFGVQQATPHIPQPDLEVMVLAGGPSLNDFEDEIREKREAGMPLITVNGSYNWALERGLAPSMQLIIDGQEHNSRFTTQVDGLTDTTRYLVASQCHPSVFEKLPLDRTLMWQVALGRVMEPHVSRIYGKKFDDWWPVPGGCTVTLRGLCALQMLGFRKFHVYGLDSCVREGGEHHAYDQPENDHQKKKWIWVTLAKGTEFEKRFRCNGWHIMQAVDFKNMANRVLQHSDFAVYGDGLIAHWIRAAAELPDVDVETNEET